jgi:NAD(P)-dependent dehydrogenase (short-subunit alcohol dehydrogenase family)
MEITGCTALVTGAAIGSGRAIALMLAELGARVVACDIDDDQGRQTARRGGGAVTFTHLDVTDGRALAAVVEATAPQILVNNAGGGAEAPWRFPDATREQWRSTLAVNLIAAMEATQLALPAMRAAGAGAVVNVASTAALGPAAHPWPEYATAKAGLVRFTTSLREFDPVVRVNCVVPDWLATERLTDAERGAQPPPIPLPDLAGQVRRLIEDDTLSGRVIVLERGTAPALLD